MSEASVNLDELDQLDALKWGSWLGMLVGLVSVVAGVIVLTKPGNSLAALAVMLGVFILINGVIELVAAVRGLTQNRGLLAVVNVIAGVFLIRHPVGGVKAVALVLGIWLIVASVVHFIAAFQGEQRIWRILVAAVEAIIGIAIVSSPHIGYTTLALITGLGFICHGLSSMALGWILHVARQEAAPATARRRASTAT